MVSMALCPQESVSVPVLPHPCRHLLLSVFSILACVVFCELYLTVVLILHFPRG